MRPGVESAAPSATGSPFAVEAETGGGRSARSAIWPNGKPAHLNGLNLSRAWMLEGIAEALGKGNARYAGLRRLAAEHREAGLRGSHWLGSFAVYLVTGRGW